MSDFDEQMMLRAVELARKGLGRVEPNPAVGAVITRDDAVLGEGCHELFGGPHAEVNAIADAGGDCEGATIYVTLEPCCHQGKTPPCTEAIISSGIARAVVAMQDPFPMVAGGGFAQLRNAGIKIEVGVGLKEALRLNAPYMKLRQSGIPYFTAKWAMTLDGKLATATGDSKWISSSESRDMVHEVRNRVNAVMVGSRTVLKDDPQLTCRIPGGRSPARIVVDTKAGLPLTSRLVQGSQDAPVWVICGQSAPTDRIEALRDAGCRVIPLPEADGTVDAHALAKALGDEHVMHVLVEGGGRLLGSLFHARLIDRVMVFIAPKLVGGEHAPTPVGAPGVKFISQAWTIEDVTTTRVASDILIEGSVVYPEHDD